MEVYWRLASMDATEREAASVELVQCLLPQQQPSKPVKKKKTAVKKQRTQDFEKSENSAHERKGTRCQSNETKEEEEEEKGSLQVKRARKRKSITGIDSHVEEDKEEEATINKQTAENDHSDTDAHDELHSGALANDDGLHNCSPAVQYALRRLVRGVASSRECARQGFAMALASLLEELPWIKIEPVLKLIKKSSEVTSSMKGQEKRDGLLGQLFALGAVVHSGRLVLDDTDVEAAKLAKDITKQLLCLAKQKAFLHEAAISVLLCFIGKLPLGLMQDSVLSSPLLQETLCMDIENASADTLLLALNLHKLLPSSVVESCPLLPKSKSTHALFEPFHLLSLVPVLKHSSSCHPRVHPVWNFLIELLFKDSNGHGLPTPSKRNKKRQKLNDFEVANSVDQQKLATFWNLVVTNSLLTSSHERKFLALELLKLVLPKLSAPCVKLILSRTFVRCLIDILAARGNLLYKSARTCLESVCGWAKADEQRIVTVIVSLQHASRGNFDVLSKTQTVKELVSLLRSKEGCFLLCTKLVELFNGDMSGPYSPDLLHSVDDGTDQNVVEIDDRKEKDNTVNAVKSLEAQRYWIIEQISSFTKKFDQQDIRLLLQKEALKFLTLNALFVGLLGARYYVKELQEELQLPKLPVSENTRKLCLARLQNVIVNASKIALPFQDMTNFGTEKIIQKEALSSDLRFFFLELCDVFDKLPEVSRVQPFSKDDKDVISSLRSCISQLCSQDLEANNELAQRMRSMCSLLMQLLLQSAATGVNDVTSELILCCNKIFGELIEMNANGIAQEEDDEAPLFMDVLVDILLSLLAQPSAPIRAATEQVFESFCSDLTESNMLSLLRVVTKQLKSGRRTTALVLDTGESDDEQFLEVEDSDDDSDVIIDTGDNDSDEDKSNDYNAEEPELKRLQRSRLSKGKVSNKEENMQSGDPDREISKDNSDSDDSSNSDMDDETMFKMDVHLANLLKQRKAANDKVKGNDAQTQLVYFKFRVLSLIDHFFQKKARSPLCLTALPHLLHAFVLSSSGNGNAQLADRISSILQGRLFKSKEYPKGKKVDKVALTGFLQRCMKLASRSKIKQVRQVAQACSLWLLKILHGQPSYDRGDTENLVNEVHDALNDFLSQRKCRLRTPFLHELFIRFPEFGLACLGLLLDKCKNARSEFLQHEALRLMNSIFHFHAGKKSSTFRESLIQQLPALSGVLVDLIENPPDNNARKSERRRFCIALLKAVAQELPEKSVEELIGKPAYNLCLSHFGAAVTKCIKAKDIGSVLT